jgi:hypothetical protein
MAVPTPPPLSEDEMLVHYLGVPVELYLELQSHNDAVLRDVAITDVERAPGERPDELQTLLVEHRRLLETREQLRMQVEAAADAGLEEVELVAVYRRADVVAFRAYVERLAAADRAADRGDVMVAPPPPGVAALRWWFVEELHAQLDGAAPTPFRY